ncbi:MAG: hypothetical protein ACRC6T_11715 [Sarcina sp.]
MMKKLISFIRIKAKKNKSLGKELDNECLKYMSEEDYMYLLNEINYKGK